MEESEKRGRNVVARRQPQQGTPNFPLPTSILPQTKPSQHRGRRNMSDFMAGVAAGLSTNNKSKNLGALLGQANTSSGGVLPKHVDFSFRDRNDASGKRRFQVKVPCRLMIVTALVFLIFPGLVFIHKELHIHESQYGRHFKTENYVNVDTKGVWDNFKLATTDEDAHDELEVDLDTGQLRQKESKDEDRLGGVVSNIEELLVAEAPPSSSLVEARNHTNHIRIIEQSYLDEESSNDGIGDGASDGAKDEELLTRHDKTSDEIDDFKSLTQNHLDVLHSTMTQPISPNVTMMVRGTSDNLNESDEEQHIKKRTNSTAMKYTSE
mmetsp:Transcript_27069/g.59705  ORF Transcript_27069/g.59705 Transcript_27069/m.59705 type:complete len:323 (-) Transcript_27069:1329-2297(-)